VLVNLISNARDAVEGRPNPKIQVLVGTKEEKLVFEVTDNGAGIPQEIRDKIFNPFFTTKEVNKGTGIGLSLVMTIVREHEGEIHFKSEINKGTWFMVTLPFKSASTGAIEKTAHTVELKAQPKIEKALRILIADDEEDLRDILQQVFARLGFLVTLATDGREALSALDKGTFDLVLSDSKMPHLTGPELFEAMVAKFPQHRPLFVLMSGDVNLSIAGFADSPVRPDQVWPKPFRIEDIKLRLAQLYPELATKFAS
jgi:CheY-like chemotaxis protein